MGGEDAKLSEYRTDIVSDDLLGKVLEITLDLILKF
jgi:hypothetical protein